MTNAITSMLGDGDPPRQDARGVAGDRHSRRWVDDPIPPQATGAHGLYRGALDLLTMPDDGIAPLLALIGAAEISLAMKMYEFRSVDIAAALIAAHARGVVVRVLLNAVRSSGERPNDAMAARLRETGVAVEWSNPRIGVTHEKSMIVDRRRALIATFNYSDKYLHQTRDFGIVVDDADIVAEIARCFEADWAGEAFHPSTSSALAWGNVTARRAVADFIDAARQRLLIQHPKFHDAVILDRVLAARERGVQVHYLCGGHHGIDVGALEETFAYQRILARAGIKLRKQHGLKLHAKMMIADGSRAFIGSMNIDRDAFDHRRELGLAFDDQAAVHALAKHFRKDWDDAKHYEPPDPSHSAADGFDREAIGDPGSVLRHE